VQISYSCDRATDGANEGFKSVELSWQTSAVVTEINSKRHSLLIIIKNEETPGTDCYKARVPIRHCPREHNMS
jgi:hypothetical protein